MLFCGKAHAQWVVTDPTNFAGNIANTVKEIATAGKTVNGTLLSPNDRYWLPRKEFRLYYTSHSTDRQTIDVYVEDNFGQKKELHFSFNGKSAEQHVDNPKPTHPTSKTERDA